MDRAEDRGWEESARIWPGWSEGLKRGMAFLERGGEKKSLAATAVLALLPLCSRGKRVS